jgi:hypothetical protein
LGIPIVPCERLWQFGIRSGYSTLSILDRHRFLARWNLPDDLLRNEYAAADKFRPNSFPFSGSIHFLFSGSIHFLFSERSILVQKPDFLLPDVYTKSVS